MNNIHALHIHMEGLSAFFKHPLTITGTQVSLPCPPYSTLLGIISACAGKNISHNDTRIGFEFQCRSTDVELERTERFTTDASGMLKPHNEGRGILKRYVHFRPQLDLYVTNLGLKNAFESPIATPSFGRSQDIAWITAVKPIELVPVENGLIGPTMIPSVQKGVPSLIVRCPEWFENDVLGVTRIAGPFGYYQAMLPETQGQFKVRMKELYHPSDSSNPEHAIYLHKWLKE